MTLYKCPRCGYLAHQRTDLRRHFMRKMVCTNIYANTSIEECFKTILHEDKPIDLKELKKPEEMTSNDYGRLKMTSECYSCPYCSKNFTRKNNCNEHIKKRCKVYKKIADDAKKDEEIEHLRKEIEMLKSNGSVKNITINNQSNNIQNNNIIINAFGKENLDYISKEFIHNIVKEGPYGSIQKLIKHIHFNPNHQENQNIKIPNKRDKYGMVFNGEKWMMKNKQSMITEIASNAYDMITDHCDDIDNKKYEKFCIEFENKQIDCIKRIMTDTELLILNCQK
jgi:uncharacterized C2H2 Zn-finger protein